MYYASRGIDVAVARIFNVLGRGVPETLSIGAFVAQLRRIRRQESAPEIRVGNLAPRRDFVDVRDACSALMAVALHGAAGQIYNVCSGESVSMDRILRELIARAAIDVRIIPDRARFKAADIADIYGANSKIRDATGWTPAFGLDASLSAIIEDLS
jgi:GDP-4-dehydro-6-deoxy-D-mannose reductase